VAFSLRATRIEDAHPTGSRDGLLSVPANAYTSLIGNGGRVCIVSSDETRRPRNGSQAVTRIHTAANKQLLHARTRSSDPETDGAREVAGSAALETHLSCRRSTPTAAHVHD